MKDRPTDPKDWTAEDWADLHKTIQRLKRRVAKRHRKVRAKEVKE